MKKILVLSFCLLGFVGILNATKVQIASAEELKRRVCATWDMDNEVSFWKESQIIESVAGKKLELADLVKEIFKGARRTQESLDLYDNRFLKSWGKAAIDLILSGHDDAKLKSKAASLFTKLCIEAEQKRLRVEEL